MRTQHPVFIGTFCLLLSNSALAGLDDGLVAYYPLDGNAQDKSSHQNHAEEIGGITYVSNAVLGQAASFDGVNNYIKAENISALELNRELSISYWISPVSRTIDESNPSEKKSTPIVMKGSHTGNNYSSWIAKDLSYISYQQYPENSDSTYTFHESYNIPEGQYIHIVSTKTGSTVKIWANGELLPPFTADYDANIKQEALFIGYDGGFGYSKYQGLIDEVRIYNRALSETEIKQLYQGSDSGTCSQVDLDTMYQQGYEAGLAAAKQANIGTVSADLKIHIPSLNYQSLTGNQNIWADFNFYQQTEDGDLIWKLNTYGLN